MFRPTRSTEPPRQRGASFPNHDLLLLLALILVVLAVAVPAWKARGLRGCLAALLLLAAILAALGLTLYGLVWLAERIGRSGSSRLDRLWSGVGHVLRFVVAAFLGMLLALPLVASHELKGPWDAILPLGSAALLGSLAVAVRIRVGKARFGSLAAGFAGALFASWALGLLSLALPWPWALDVAILGPFAVFAVLGFRRRPPTPAGMDGPPDPTP